MMLGDGGSSVATMRPPAIALSYRARNRRLRGGGGGRRLHFSTTRWRLTGYLVLLGFPRTCWSVKEKRHRARPSTLGLWNGELVWDLKQVKKERDRVEPQFSGLNAALAAFAGVYRGAGKP